MKLVFIGKEHKVGDVYSFKFSYEDSFSWLAGQSIRLELETDYLADERRFTISSAPSEKQISITTKLSDSNFKRALAKLKSGDEIKAYGLEGDFIWPDGAAHLPIFLANGLGITPFRSMLAERASLKQPLKASLIYSHQPGLAVFKPELEAWQKSYPELEVEYLSDRRLTADLTRQLVPEILISPLYISGSSEFVNDLSKNLIKNYMVKSENIKLDEFTGL